MPRITVSTGLRLFYQEAGAGPSLLLMDGLGAGWVWFKNLPALSRRFRVVALDNRGTGGSDKPPGPYSVEVMARETADVIQALGLGRTHLAGLSLGGSVAQEVALSYPDLAGSLVLIGSTPGGVLQVPTPPDVVPLLLPLPNLSPWANFRRTMMAALSPEYVASHPAEFAEIGRRALAAPTPVHARMSMGWAGATWRGIAGRSQAIVNPVLVLAGQIDRLTPVVNAYRLAGLIPHARLHLFPGSGHLVEIEQAERFNQIVMGFLEGRGPGTSNAT
jgi:pimeloyl-ACP methyl ester carboxylesterase